MILDTNWDDPDLHMLRLATTALHHVEALTAAMEQAERDARDNGEPDDTNSECIDELVRVELTLTGLVQGLGIMARWTHSAPF